jgi:membrane protein implicated in regulation of membrane protease activity
MQLSFIILLTVNNELIVNCIYERSYKLAYYFTKLRVYTLVSIGSMVAVLIGVVNLLTFRELWVLLAAVAILVILAVYAVKEKRKLQRRQQTHNHTNSKGFL